MRHGRRRVLHACRRSCCRAASSTRRARTAVRTRASTGRVVMTNTPPNGAFRGFGAPQTQFAMEVHMDRIAEAARAWIQRRCGCATRSRPATPRRRARSCGRDSSAASRCLREAVRRSGFRRKRAELRGHATAASASSLFYHGAGFTGSGEVMLGFARRARDRRRRACASWSPAPRSARARARCCAQIVADALGVHVRAGGGGAARHVGRAGLRAPRWRRATCMVVGEHARALREANASSNSAGASPAEHHAKHGRLHVEEQYQAPEGRQWSDDETYRGDAYATYAWGCDVAEVELDADHARGDAMTKLRAVQEFGRPIHPAWRRGQIEGGTAQGIGWALLERGRDARRPRWRIAQLTNYVIPTTLDTPPHGRRDARTIRTPAARSAPRAWASCRSTAPRPRS